MANGFSVELDDSDALAWMNDLPSKIRAALLEKMSSVSDRLKAKIEAELSGGLLNARSGHLRDSIKVTVASSENGVAANISSSSPYAGAMEFGVHKDEMVPASKRDVTAIFGSTKEAIMALVRPHERLMDIGGRHFMMLAAQDVQASFVEEMTDAVSKVLAD